MTIKLTKSAIEALSPNASKRYAVYDAEVTGLHVIVTTAGMKTFYLYYRNRSGRGRNFKLGRFPLITIQQARILAKNALYEIARGEDPSADRDSARKAQSITQACEKFLTEYVRPKLKSRTVEQYERIIDKRIKPKFGSTKVNELSRFDIQRWHAEMSKHPREANHALAVLSKIMTEAWRTWEMRQNNPCSGIKRYSENRRERFLSQNEFARLGNTLLEMEVEGGTSTYAIAAIRLLCFTGCRLNEVLTLQWEHVDFEHRCLRLPDSKTGAKVVHIGTPAIEVLSALKALPDVPWVFPGRSLDEPIKHLHSTWSRVRKGAGLAGVRLHDLRHSFASVGAAGGLGLPIIGKVLGHAHVATTARYAHLADAPVKEAVNSISNNIAGAMGNKSAEIIVMKKVGNKSNYEP